jgi:hypothetical protein
MINIIDAIWEGRKRLIDEKNWTTEDEKRLRDLIRDWNNCIANIIYCNILLTIFILILLKTSNILTIYWTSWCGSAEGGGAVS